MPLHMTCKNVREDEVSQTCNIFISCRDPKRITVFVVFVKETEQADAKLNDTRP